MSYELKDKGQKLKAKSQRPKAKTIYKEEKKS
jgi:hypothetical protein